MQPRFSDSTIIVHNGITIFLREMAVGILIQRLTLKNKFSSIDVI